MNESNRVPPRVRPRPYDLRRRVLLKNFLREQMTHIPRLPESSLDQHVNSNSFEHNPSLSMGNEENIETSNVPDQVSSTTSILEPVISSPSFKEDKIEDDTVSSTCETATTTEAGENPVPKVSRFSNLLRLKISSVQKKQGISKAKLKLKTKSPTKKAVLRLSRKVSSESSVRDKARTFFSLFKAHRGKKRKKITKGSPPSLSSSSPGNSSDNRNMSNQSVQTDTDWSNNDYHNLEQSNKSLREENRLLSESLSSIMSDFSFKLSPLKIPYGTNSYITANGTSEISHRSGNDLPQYNDNRNLRKSGLPNLKVLRSKSLYERNNRGNFPRAGLRTRSMNRGCDRFSESNSGESYSRFRSTSNGLYRAKGNAFLPTNDNSNFNHQNSIPVHQANTRMTPYTSPVLKNLPNNSNRIVRRSSMPERMAREPVRPLIRRSSTRNGTYSHKYSQNGSDSYRDRLEDQDQSYSHKRRSSSNYSRPVPFQDLPPEAFY